MVKTMETLSWREGVIDDLPMGSDTMGAESFTGRGSHAFAIPFSKNSNRALRRKQRLYSHRPLRSRDFVGSLRQDVCPSAAA